MARKAAAAGGGAGRPGAARPGDGRLRRWRDRVGGGRRM